MSLYYDGDLEKDIADLKCTENPVILNALDEIGREIGYGRAQQIMQVLWAKYLAENDYPTSGALFR